MLIAGRRRPRVRPQPQPRAARHDSHRLGQVAHLGAGQHALALQQPVQRGQAVVRHRRVQVMLEVVVDVVRKEQRAAR